jgi:predicted dehydrogenase
MKRRQFIKSAGLIGASTLILPRTRLFGADAPSNKLNIALIGTWGRGAAHFSTISAENVVALCDVDENHLASAAKKFPNAKTYVDWRKMYEQKDINAVVICTADHTHAHCANWAMNRGWHVYLEKPLANTVEEARVVRANFLKNKTKIATQVGTQRHEHENFNRIRELILDGAIGKLEACSAWGNRQIPKPGYLPSAGEPPSHLHYDLWIGPSPYHPYNPGYFSGGPGANCLQWNMYWDFGNGQIGDMGSHTIDLAWNAMDVTLPIAAEGKGETYNPEVAPVRAEFHMTMPKNGNSGGPVKVSWYQGGAMPESPDRAIDLKKIDHGAMWEGDKGTIVGDFRTRLIYPFKNAGFDYYQPRKKEDQLPPLGNFQKQWVNAAKGNLKTSCDFEYSANYIESVLVGMIAYKVGRKIQYNPEKGEVVGDAEANAFVKKKYREGWPLNG